MRDRFSRCPPLDELLNGPAVPHQPTLNESREADLAKLGDAELIETFVRFTLCYRFGSQSERDRDGWDRCRRQAWLLIKERGPAVELTATHDVQKAIRRELELRRKGKA